jgi:hypothetical protein
MPMVDEVVEMMLEEISAATSYGARYVLVNEAPEIVEGRRGMDCPWLARPPFTKINVDWNAAGVFNFIQKIPAELPEGNTLAAAGIAKDEKESCIWMSL